MQTKIQKRFRSGFIAVSFLIILAVSVVAGTFAASTYDEVNRSFGWSIDTSYDSRFKPVTNIKGKLGNSTETTVDVTSNNYSGTLKCENEGDEKVRVTLGGNTYGGSAFYNTNLVYTLTAPANGSVYAKFRIFQDRIIPVDCDEATLNTYVSGLTVSDVDNTYGVCETLSFDLTVPIGGMNITFTPMYGYIPVEIRHRVVDENGNYLRDGDSSLTTTVERYQYSSTNATDYTNNKYFYVSSNTDYYDNLTSASPSYVQNSFTASGASTKAWMAKGYYFHGFYLNPRTATGYNFKDITYVVSSRTNETVSDGNDVSSDRRNKVSGFGIAADGNRFRLEYGDSSDWDSDFIAADSIVAYVNYTQDSSYTPTVTPGTNYSITVNSHFENAVNDDEHSQYIEIYNDTTQNPIARVKNHVSAAMPAGNTTPTLNLKSNSKVSVKSITVKDADGTDITAQAFGYDQYYTDFIESCKTSLFGYLELQNITGNITVDVTYDEPIADQAMGQCNSNLPYYSVTVITKGDVGPYGKAYRSDYEYQDVNFGSGYSTFNVGDEKPSGSASGRVYNPSGHYTMRDGSQITRYDYSSNTSYFDLSYYSYISDIKMYYNDTGEEVKTLNLAGEAYTTSRYNSYSGGSEARSVTYVVTYKAFDNTTVYANIQTLQNKTGRGKIRLDADEGGRFADFNNSGITSSNTYTYGIDENTDPFYYDNSSGGYYGKVKALNTDTVKFYFDNEQGNSIDFRHFKVYSLDVDGNTYGEQIAGEGCENPLLTLTYSPARDSWDDDGWVTISGLRNYDGDIYVTADTYRYNHQVNIRQSGEHTDSFTITADDEFGAISGAGQTGDAVNMSSSCTKTADSGSTDHWMYSGGQYTVKSNGDQRLQKVTLTYYPMNGNYSYSARTTDTYDTKNADGSISFTFPTDSYYSQTSNKCYLTVYYEPITTYEAQVYMTASGAPVTTSYYLRYNSANMVEVSTFNDDTPSANLFTTVLGVTTSYQTKSYEKITSTGDSDIYKIAPGTKVKVKNIFKEESRAVSSTLPQSLIDFVNRRFTFKGVKVYKASDFSHNRNATATLGEELTVTQDGDDYVFTMPESGVRIVPEYEQHVRAVNILSNERNGNNTYHITKSSLGSATLTGDENNWFISKSWYDCDDSYDDTNNAGHAWTTNRILTLDSSRFTLTATPADSANYTVKAVKAYKYAYNSGTAQNNKIYQSELTATTYDWLTYDNEGNITNEEISGVVGTLSDPDSNGARSCTVTLPDTLDVGNIVLWVDFEPVETTTFAHFKYEPDTTSAKPFNPIVNLKSVFTGDYASYARVSATDGADVEAAVYNEDNTQYMNVELGGNNKFRSGFYQYNLVYTIKDYSNDTVLAKFRVYRDQIYPVDCTEEQLNEYLVTSACTFEEVSGTSGVCEKAILRFKLPENGITLSYQSERLYIPVTVKQYVKDANGQYQPANNDLTATLTKYFENTSNLSDFAQNKYFATDSTLTSSYGLNDAQSSAFADTVTVTGAEETHYMLIENLQSWQGFYIQPSTARGYTVSSDGIEQTSYNRLGNANTWDGYMSSDTKTYVEGSGYRVRYHAEYRSDMSLNSSDINSHMGAQSVEIKVYYEETDDLYSSVSYTPSGTFKPNTVFKGTIRNDADGVVSGTDGASMSAAVYNGESVDLKYLTMEVGGGSNSTSEANGSIFHEANLVYTLTDPNTNIPLLKFRIYRGKVEPVDNYSQAAFEQYIKSASVEGYNTDTYSGLREKATVKIKVPEDGLSITYTAETPYIPVTVKQYKLDSEGNATAAGESYTSAVTKYYTGSNDYGKYKFFAGDSSLTDSYGLGSANQSEFVNSYTVTGASDTHYMVYLNEFSGMYLMPSAPEGYSLATIKAKALNSAENEIASSYDQSLTDIPTVYDTTNGYRINYSYPAYPYLRGATIEVDVYYQPTTTLTVKQQMDGHLESGTLATVTVTNANAEAPQSPYKAYIDPDHKLADSVTLTDTSANVTETDEEVTGALFRTSKLGVNKGTKPSIKIEPKGARNVSSVTILKKNGNEYVEVPASDYTVSGSGAVLGTLTYTFNNNVNIGDDYLVNIVYGTEKTLTVKTVLLNANNSENEVDTEAEFNECKATVTVSGKLYDTDGNKVGGMPFVDKSVEPNDNIDTFTVTSSKKTVTGQTNTNVTINTSIGSGSQYVIANVKALKDDGSTDLHLVVPGTKKYDGKDVTTYENCTMPSLTSSDNVTVVVYLAKVAQVKVNVYNVRDSVNEIKNGVPNELGADAYVNVNVTSNSINQKAIITKESEGGYYTGDFDITYNPHSREVSVLQGSKLEIFAQLPQNGQYVIKKVVSNGTGYQNVTVNNVNFVNDNLRETLNTGSESISADKTYELNIYIEKAKSIFTRATNDNNGTGTYTSGSVTMRGENSETGVIPFTKIHPASANPQHPEYYDAVTTSSSLDYTTEAKCVRGTALTFDVKPQSNYTIKSVTVKKGSDKSTATDAGFSQQSTASDGTVTYKITDTMPYYSNLYIDVEFEVVETGTITIDYQYSDDFVHYKNLFDPTEGISEMSVSSYLPGVAQHKITDLIAGDSFDSKSGITYDSSKTTYKFKSLAGNRFSVSSTVYRNGRWYIPVEGECYTYDNNTNKIVEQISSINRTNCGQDHIIKANDDLTYHYRLVPMARIGDIVVLNNCYDNTPEGVYKEDSGAVSVQAHFTNAENYNPQIQHAMMQYPSCSWTDSASLSYNADIVAGSVIDSVTVDYKNMVKPGTIKNVIIKEYEKSSVSMYYDNKYADYADKKPTRTWTLTKSVSDSNDDTYIYKPGETITVLHDMDYRVFVDYDRIDVHSSISGSGSGYVKSYLFYVNNASDINLSASQDSYERVTTNRYDESIKSKTSAYYVLVSDLPSDELSLNYAQFRDYSDYNNPSDILQTLKDSYTPRTNSSGVTKYYYYYKINDNKTNPIVNTLRFTVYTNLKTDNPTVVEEDLDCNITVEQWNRDTYDGNYVAASNQSATFSVENGKVLRKNSKAGEDANPITISTATGYMYSEKKTELTITPNPAEGYNVEKVDIVDGSTGTYYPNSQGIITHTLSRSDVTIKIYYSRPLLRISSTNEGNEGKAVVDVVNNTTGSTETILTKNTFTNGTFVTKNDDAQVIIKPLQYESEGGVQKYYKVASIRIGDAFNNTLTAYTDADGDVANDDYTVTKAVDDSEYVLTLNNVQKDKYIFIQLVGDQRILSSNLQVNQQIRYAGTTDFVDCSEGSYGAVKATGTLNGNNTPLNFYGTDYSEYTFNDRASVEGTVIDKTALSFEATAPEGYEVIGVEAVMNGENITVKKADGKYSLANTAPDSGTTVVTVKYGIKQTDFTLKYKYYSREWNADKESNYENTGKVIGSNTTPDKTYTVNVSLTDAQLIGDKPIKKVLVDNAPAIEDLYKDCKWKFDDAHVEYNGNKVTITPDQPAKTYTVKFFKNNGEQNEFETITQVKLNSLVKKDGKFITAEKTLGGSDFAYWLINKAGTNKEVAKCYSAEFNYRVTADIDVIAYYGAKAKSITISDPKFTREQTDDGNGNITDKLFTDFILSYMEDNGKLFNPSTAASEGVETLEGYESGLVVEFDSTIKLERKDETGHKLTDEEKVIFPAEDTVSKNTIISFINGEKPTLPSTRTLINLPVNNSSYNNKNRVNKVLDFNNSENARHTVLRAYYYVIDKDGNVELTDPVYFYLYDIGNSDSSTEE